MIWETLSVVTTRARACDVPPWHPSCGAIEGLVIFFLASATWLRPSRFVLLTAAFCASFGCWRPKGGSVHKYVRTYVHSLSMHSTSTTPVSLGAHGSFGSDLKELCNARLYAIRIVTAGLLIADLVVYRSVSDYLDSDPRACQE
jgi:hypothetical protein